MRTLDHHGVRKLLLERAEAAQKLPGAGPLVTSIYLLAEAHEREIQRRLKEVDLADS